MGWGLRRKGVAFSPQPRLLDECCFVETCRQSIAPIVAAARCFVSGMGMQRL
ncbi:MAG: hypothetical protein WCL14_05335 [Bacteroidota bacterium]